MDPSLPPPPASNGYRYRIVLFGDSQTQYSFKEGSWGAALANYYQRKADVVCRGYGGYQTRWALSLLPFVFPVEASVASNNSASSAPPPKANLMSVVFFGTNDASSGSQHVPLEEFGSNMVAILTAAAAVSSVVVAITPGVVDESLWMERSLSTVSKYCAAIEAAVESVKSTTPSTTFVSFNLLEAGLAEAKETSRPFEEQLSDGLHFSSYGSAVLIGGLVDKLAAAAPKALPDALTIDFPLWREVDNTSVKTAELSFSKEAIETLHSTPRPS